MVDFRRRTLIGEPGPTSFPKILNQRIVPITLKRTILKDDLKVCDQSQNPNTHKIIAYDWLPVLHMVC